VAVDLRGSRFNDSGHFHSTSKGKDEALETWLEKGGFITAIGALGTGVNFLRIVYIVHVGVPYRLVDFA
jgi:hypothetical protein